MPSLYTCLYSAIVPILPNSYLQWHKDSFFALEFVGIEVTMGSQEKGSICYYKINYLHGNDKLEFLS